MSKTDHKSEIRVHDDVQLDEELIAVVVADKCIETADKNRIAMR